MDKSTKNLRIKDLEPLISPALLRHELPMSVNCHETVYFTRQEISNILSGRDDRIVVVVGPCSIHDPTAALEYAERLMHYATEAEKELCIIMRVYFEKPRTTLGWKGLINDPYMDNSFEINHGLRLARKLIVDINALGVPTGTEFLDMITPQYIAELMSWGAIGARTTESQTHRELASGLSMPVGFKNTTLGSVKIAVDAIASAKNPHHFLGVTNDGVAAIVSTTGNDECHLILRGSSAGTNYDAKSVAEAIELEKKSGIDRPVMVDCSHGNSEKDYKKQMKVVDAICEQIQNGSKNIFGLMIESNLVEGNQAIVPGKPLTYGQSVTDACISWDETKIALDKLRVAVKARRKGIRK